VTKLSPVELWRWNILMGNLTTLLLVIYAVILVNTLVKIWHAEFKDARERFSWFLFVLILSPIGIPAYLILNKNRKERKRGTAKKEQKTLAQQLHDAGAQQAATPDADKERELARLLEMKKNGVLSSEEFEKAKTRLSSQV
jgi:ABC-type nickel/cobalt efflux system permease component RcnA